VSDLEARVAALEARLDALAPAAGGPPQPPGGDDVFWALNELKRQVPGGAVLFTGVVPVPAGTGTGSGTYGQAGSLDASRPRPAQLVQWQYGRLTDELFAEDWAELVGTLSALAHPVRLKLLREVLGGRHSAADLGAVEGLGTTGQLYHHLRQLVGAGWLRMHGRGQYAMPGDRIVPLLVILAAARR
jgi:hypothetical protein